MAKSRTSSKSKKSKSSVPKWVVAAVVVLLVAVAGYAIIRFSEASTLRGLRMPRSMQGCINKYDKSINGQDVNVCQFSDPDSSRNTTVSVTYTLEQWGNANRICTLLSLQAQSKVTSRLSVLRLSDNYSTPWLSSTAAAGVNSNEKFYTAGPFANSTFQQKINQARLSSEAASTTVKFEIKTTQGPFAAVQKIWLNDSTAPLGTPVCNSAVTS